MAPAHRVEMQQLELKVIPPLVMLFVASGMWLVAMQLPSLQLPLPYNVGLAIILAACGIAVALLGAFALRRFKTTINPMNPGAATSLVNSSIYAWTRNPIYLGDLLILLGWAAYLSNLLCWFLPMLFVLYINRFQIQPEEVHLKALFGDAFDAYTAIVRRWF